MKVEDTFSTSLGTSVNGLWRVQTGAFSLKHRDHGKVSELPSS